VEYLLRRHSDVNHVSNSGRTALWKAAQAGHREVVLRLVTAGAEVNTQNQVSRCHLDRWVGFSSDRRVGVSSDR
jgi:ankyrin repeat protein